jgi:pyruvate/2-oxoglutarate dehydrogenase complex dihydrolipoamide dehydrogenase (E3) component
MGGKNKKPISYDYDLVVIGAGTAGSIGANLAASNNKKVAIVESSRMGGEQVWSTTIPTKWLVASLKLQQKATRASSFGLDISVSPVNIEKLKHYLNKASTQASGSEIAEFKDDNIKTYKGQAEIIDKYHISIQGKKISFKYLLIASGASPNNKVAQIFNIEKYLTYQELASLNFTGNSFCFVGAGSVAYEYSQILTMMGFKVHIIEKNNHVLPRADSEVSDMAEEILNKNSVKVHTGSYIEAIKEENDKSTVYFIKNQRRYRLVVDNIVLATGKKPNIENLGLDNANIHFSESGIKTNKKLQTSQKNIFAAGEVIGSNTGYEAAYDSQIAIHNMFYRRKINKSHKALPKVLYGPTEIATVGLSELQLKLSGGIYQSSIAPSGITTKAITSQFDLGFVKLLADHKGTIVGASVVGENASELINLLSVAINCKMQACKLANTVFASPSWSEAIKVASSKIYCL